jgi:hypothetical protein
MLNINDTGRPDPNRRWSLACPWRSERHQFANTWDETGLYAHGEEIEPVDLQHAQSRLEAMHLGVPPMVLAEFEEARPRLQPPLAQGCYGLDLVNYLWDIKD